jgi:hypothetical protein
MKFFKENFMTDFDFKDPFERWQYRIFRILLLVLFLIAAARLIDSELHISDWWR